MNLKILILLCLVTILTLPDADAWGVRRRIRFRVRLRRVVRVVCSVSCKVKGCKYTWVHHKLRRVCHRTCGRVCRKIFGKRDADESLGMIQDDIAFNKRSFSAEISLRQPARLSMYDTDKDGRISRAEFMAIQPRDSDVKSIKKAFDAMDTNGDHYIDCKEFLKAKVEYRGRPRC
ncbi:uncharacterized protein LOC110234278 [Exaiptasia diaphana]|uniref:EF-hand domain-containing protein n=1 Tax=Exaiptasia diaphana TaxID=2652724 RepID=A0A913WWU1_EXADI|nr:uncharacterized protein LOC110234278 [Exaiptasia diaphana]KXJ17202.1 hypothetical protein AC249_AIPGENE12315 [Exaiptasia diaphana]